MTKEIVLPSGHVCLVDNDDFEKISKHKWHIDEKGYARRRECGRWVWMQYYILPRQGGVFIDHANGNKLDNRKTNLRYATREQNARNRKINSNSKTGFKGVVLERGKWIRAIIRISGKRKCIGYFKDLESAARAYDEAAKENFGEFARLNYP